MMKDLYLKPEVELKKFDTVDVIKCSDGPNNGEGVVANEDPTGKVDWSIYG
ncbi:MAG: hypothetical protein IKF24_03795 [Eubacterium sp.]|nr:hypothetical protein [Eubacterium sp.]